MKPILDRQGKQREARTPCRVGGCRGCAEATGVSQSGAATGTDLGSSSNYSSEILED